MASKEKKRERRWQETSVKGGGKQETSMKGGGKQETSVKVGGKLSSTEHTALHPKRYNSS
jgi:hypothetical protein